MSRPPKNPKYSSVKCVVQSCPNTVKDNSVTFHSFPSNLTIRNQWLAWLNVIEFDPNKNTRICSQHFTVDSYEQNLNLLESIGYSKPYRMRLRNGACPSIMTPKDTTDSLSQQVIEANTYIPTTINAKIESKFESAESTIFGSQNLEIHIPMEISVSPELDYAEEKKCNLNLAESNILQHITSIQPPDMTSKYVQTVPVIHIPGLYKRQHVQTAKTCVLGRTIGVQTDSPPKVEPMESVIDERIETLHITKQESH